MTSWFYLPENGVAESGDERARNDTKKRKIDQSEKDRYFALDPLSGVPYFLVMPLENVEKLKRDIVFQEQLRGHTYTFHSTWGLFNPKRVDEGSRLLLDRLEVAANATCLDIGCGYGPIGLVLARLAPEGLVHMVDKDFVAVDYARKNAALNRLSNCQIYLSNGFGQVPALRFDTIVSNLPAKAGNEMLSIILHEARDHLREGGRFYVVTISGLKDYIKRNFREVFGNYKKVKQGKTYTVSLAVRE